MKTFEEFKTAIKENMEQRFPDAQITLESFAKNNGLYLDAIIIRNKKERIAPVIYLNPFYKCYTEGSCSFDKILDYVSELSKTRSTSNEFVYITDQFSDFDSIKDKIYFSVVNTAANAERLQDILHTEFEDLSFIYHIYLSASDNDELASVTIRNEHLKYWNVSKETIHTLAMKNSQILFPVVQNNLQDILASFHGKRDYSEQELNEISQTMEHLSKLDTFYIISNEKRINGFAAIFYSDILATLSDRLQTDLYILPSSVHECLVISTECRIRELDELKAMVHMVNRTEVSPEDVLSDNVYRYCRETGKISIA